METDLVRDYLSNYLSAKVPHLVKRELQLNVVKGKATTIVGPRRAGKTSLMWQEIAKCDRQQAIYLDFEDIAIRGLSAPEALRVITDVFTEVSGKKASTVFLDEIQNVDNWQSLVRTLLDRGYKVYATGSSSRLLAREIATQLRGRSSTHLLLPFSFSEYLTATGEHTIDPNSLSEKGRAKNLLDKYLRSGGFPEVVLGGGDKDKLLVEYRELIFFKDFVERQKARSTEVARHMFNFVTQCYAGEMSVRRILAALKSNGVPFGRNTVYDYIEKLQDTLVFFFLGRYSAKVSLRASWPKKVYLADNGLAWRLPYDGGRMMENAVFLELKRRLGQEPASELYYYRDPAGHEVDFVVKNGAKIKELIQVTGVSDRTEVRRGETEALLKASKELRCGNLTVITWDYEGEERIGGSNINYVPLWVWLLEGNRSSPVR
jgi:predicted AAA+ superfamily ATPase